MINAVDVALRRLNFPEECDRFKHWCNTNAKVNVWRHPLNEMDLDENSDSETESSNFEIAKNSTSIDERLEKDDGDGKLLNLESKSQQTSDTRVGNYFQEFRNAFF